MEYYYTSSDKINYNSGVITIDDFEFKHLIKVLRKKCGDSIDVTDGKGIVYNCLIEKINKDNLTCRILDKHTDLHEPDVRINLYLSLLRDFSRFEFAVEKCVELGVNSITPVITEFTISKQIPGNTKMERMKKIMISAMGQSQRCFLPELNDVIRFGEMISSTNDTLNKVVMYEFSEDDTGFTFNSDSKEVALLIGPEGGFSNGEVDSLRSSGWQVKSLGKRKYRAETAAIVSVFDLISRLHQS